MVVGASSMCRIPMSLHTQGAYYTRTWNPSKPYMDKSVLHLGSVLVHSLSRFLVQNTIECSCVNAQMNEFQLLIQFTFADYKVVDAVLMMIPPQ